MGYVIESYFEYMKDMDNKGYVWYSGIEQTLAMATLHIEDAFVFESKEEAQKIVDKYYQNIPSKIKEK